MVGKKLALVLKGKAGNLQVEIIQRFASRLQLGFQGAELPAGRFIERQDDQSG